MAELSISCPNLCHKNTKTKRHTSHCDLIDPSFRSPHSLASALVFYPRVSLLFIDYRLIDYHKIGIDDHAGSLK